MAIPVGVCSIPVMLFGLAAALLEQPLFPELAIGMAIALGVSWLWTHFSLRRQVAEIFVRGDAAALRSVHDALQNAPLEWKRVFQVKRRPDRAELAIGRDEVTLRPKEWPRFDLLLDELDYATFKPFADQ